MKVSNLNSKYLEIKSENYSNLIANNKLASITINAKLHDREEVSKTIDYPIPSVIWSMNEIPINNARKITGFYVTNVFTGRRMNILESPIHIGSPLGASVFKQTVAARFLALFDTIVTQTLWMNYPRGLPPAPPTATPPSFNYTITNLPSHLTADALESIYGGVTSEETFIGEDENGVAFDNESILLLPSFFGLGKTYPNSIVHIELLLKALNEDYIREETCFFIDTTMKCDLPSLHNLECVDEGIQLTMLHYSLVQASNCDCGCIEMIQVFEHLQSQLRHVNNQPKDRDCGC